MLIQRIRIQDVSKLRLLNVICCTLPCTVFTETSVQLKGKELYAEGAIALKKAVYFLNKNQ